MAAFSGARTEYNIDSDIENHMIVTDLVAGRDGTDTIYGYFEVRFTDGTFLM